MNWRFVPDCTSEGKPKPGASQNEKGLIATISAQAQGSMKAALALVVEALDDTREAQRESQRKRHHKSS